MIFTFTATLSILSASGVALADLLPAHRFDLSNNLASPLTDGLGFSQASDSSDASGPFTLSLKKTNSPSTTDGLRDLVQGGRDRLRQQHGKEFLNQADVYNDSLVNTQVSFIAEVGIGAGTYNLIVDTGSANTWCGAQQPYAPSGASTKTGQIVSVRYGSGSFVGTEVQDTVTIGNLKLEQQGVGAAYRSHGFQGVDGILGLGPSNLTRNTLHPGTQETVPTVIDTALSQGSIQQATFGVFFRPTSGSDPEEVGELTIGGSDNSKFTSDLMTAPLTTTSPASRYWGLDLSLLQGNQTIMASAAGIIDTGTTLVYIPQDAFYQYVTNVGGELDQTTGLVKIPSDNLDSIQNLTFTTSNGHSIALNKYAQLVSRQLYPAFGLDDNYLYSWINMLDGDSVDFIVGQKFLERYYSVYSAVGGGSVSFAETKFTFPDSL